MHRMTFNVGEEFYDDNVLNFRNLGRNRPFATNRAYRKGFQRVGECRFRTTSIMTGLFCTAAGRVAPEMRRAVANVKIKITRMAFITNKPSLHAEQYEK